jgi:hypothetical protein
MYIYIYICMYMRTSTIVNRPLYVYRFM